MRKKFYLTLLILLLPLFVYSQVVKVNMGSVDEVEFIGLEKWTPQMVLDSLVNCTDSTCFIGNVYKIYCNDCLQKTLPFPSIHAVSHYKENKKIFVAISIVEPQYANLIQYLALPHSKFENRKEWDLLIEACDMGDVSFQIAVQLYSRLFHKRSESFIDSSLSALANEGFDGNSIKKYWEIIYKYNAGKDFENAIYTLENDMNLENRKAAICILLNFGEQEKTYSMIFNLFRTRLSAKENDLVDMVFRSLMNSQIPQLDIRSLEESLVPLLNGTNIQYFIPIMEFLSSVPNIDESSKAVILQNSRRLCIAYLKSETYRDEMKTILESITNKKIENATEYINYLDNMKINKRLGH